MSVSDSFLSDPITPFDLDSDEESPSLFPAANANSPALDPASTPSKPKTSKPKAKERKKQYAARPQVPKKRQPGAAASAERLDKPPGYKLGPAKFFKYWQEQYEKHPDCFLVYAYRHFPVIDVEQLDPVPDKNILKQTEPLTEEEFIQKLGCGDYFLRLNGLAEGGTVCNTTLSTHRDFKLAPPELDLKTLVLGDPKNAGYIQWLTRTGVRIPGLDPIDDAKEKGDLEEMAATDALVEIIKDQQVTIREGNNKPSVTAVPIQPRSPDADTMATAINLIADTSKKQTDALYATVTSLNEMNRTSNDPMQMISRISEMAKTLYPPKDDTLLQELMKSNREMQMEMSRERAERMANLERELKEQRQTATLQQNGGTIGGASLVNPSAGPKSLVEQMKEMRELKDTFEHLLGDGGGGKGKTDVDDEPGFSWGSMFMKNLPLIITAGTSLFGMGASMMHNSAVARTGVGEPMPPPPAPPIPSHYMGAMPNGLPAIPGHVPQTSVPASVPAYGPQLVTNPQPQDDPNMMFPGLAQYHQYLETIRPALLRSFGSGEEDGADFAEAFIAFHGRPAYDELRGSGKATLMMLMESYPPLWDQVKQFRGKFEVFLDEFLDYDRIAAEEGEGDEGEEGGAGDGSGKGGTV